MWWVLALAHRHVEDIRLFLYGPLFILLIPSLPLNPRLTISGRLRYTHTAMLDFCVDGDASDAGT